ncbi:MAG: hypothetical protein AVDCRST_MAG87-3193 [uncultured Thermomicrobiales bacterium]|uniref:Uncharacterized protein n=1 Tax=uncultured Thermomicrobiales bacterium TaxID=1645740 RepID=A0A6J4VLV2_9BACT|nr:MAG: hypothetical protein AVDCRST_MAG87-3193 [uncultured Thermomicrobiales bacterium]
MAHPDLADGVWAGRRLAGRAGRCGDHDLAEAPFSAGCNASFSFEVCLIADPHHTKRPIFTPGNVVGADRVLTLCSGAAFLAHMPPKLEPP